MVGHSGKRRTAKQNDKDEEETWVDALDQALDDLNVNRLTTREKALTALQGILRKHNATSVLRSRTEEFVQSLLKCVDNGESALEIESALQLLGLAFLNHGDDIDQGDQELLYQDTADSIRRKVKKATTPLIKAKCFETLGLITYIMSLDIDAQMIRQEMQAVLTAQNDADDDDVLAAATLAYALTFIISFCDDGIMAPALIQEEMDTMLEHLAVLMEMPGRAQSAAAQTAALMMEAWRACQVDDQDENQMNELIHTLRELSIDPIDEDDEEEVELFDAALSTIESGIAPSRECEIRHKTFTLETWATLIPANAFKRYLDEEGLAEHLKSKDVLWKLYNQGDMERSESESDSDEPSLAAQIKYTKVSKFNKNMVYQENKKSRTKQRTTARSGKDTKYL
ncbi:interferon-related developmental regulator-domain-containing protein [Gongronella butleri]|nr:interferon-related developmental regulator-domain-containing protein [Gongronella butleri]